SRFRSNWCEFFQTKSDLTFNNFCVRFSIPSTDFTPTLTLAPERKLIICDVLETLIVDGTIPSWYFLSRSFLKKERIVLKFCLSKMITRSRYGFKSKKGIS